ncbi:MAG: TIGR04295 family B12-binding domain-containing radical SAM protein [Polyangiaceae bacterium]|nr:TIGR04295 family B12-binding domain-containing radical SAM protein [Polyangiaceae bacterium]
MRVALVNPPVRFEGSVYFGCREPHLPLELGYARALLARAGHEARIIDAQARGLDLAALRGEVQALGPDMTVIATAPSYLFWRCAPPELRSPMAAAGALRDVGGAVVGVGPHASTAPGAALRKLGADAVVVGECEEVLVRLADTPRARWGELPSVVVRGAGQAARATSAAPAAADLAALPALRWTDDEVARHAHHHHRFDASTSVGAGPGAEIEASRGCPYHCTFCAKERFRDRYRKRPLEIVLDELDALIAQGVRYAYFIDEIFLPDAALLEAVARRGIAIGVQLRIDQWSEEALDLLGRAGCVSIEAGVESVTAEGRAALDKRCKRSTGELVDRLIHARRRVPFVQANLLSSTGDDPADVAAFRSRLREHGVWANEPVPLFPYPGSPEYGRRWGEPDDAAWERAHAHYLAEHRALSDLQDEHPLPLPELEHAT